MWDFPILKSVISSINSYWLPQYSTISIMLFIISSINSYWPLQYSNERTITQLLDGPISLFPSNNYLLLVALITIGHRNIPNETILLYISGTVFDRYLYSLIVVEITLLVKRFKSGQRFSYDFEIFVG
jgi:hypothetical protein